MCRNLHLTVLLFIFGCGAVGSDHPKETVSGSESGSSLSLFDDSLEEVPTGINVQNFELTALNDSQPEPPNPGDDRPTFFDGIRQVIGDNHAFDDDEVSGGLMQSLERAEETFREIRQSNREAIRKMNRQLRVGQSKSTPHVILVTLPQLRYDHLPEMPRLSGVMRSGRFFTNYYAASDDIQAARWSLYTGQFASQFSNSTTIAGTRSLPEAMWQSGYATTLLGAWGSKQHPIEIGFDHWTGFPSQNGAVDRYPEFFFTQATKARIIKDDSGTRTTSLDLLEDEVETFLKQQVKARRQFFLHVTLPYLNGIEETENVKSVDQSIGAIVDTLNDTGLSGRVCLMITGETTNHEINSGQQSSSLVNEKLSASKTGLNEGNLRTPLIVFWGNIAKRGSTSDFPCTTLDLFPTIADIILSQRSPKRFTGVSLVDEIKGEETRVERLLYWKLSSGEQAARRGRWKVILPRGEKTMRLYDLENDPSESKNVAENHPDILKSFIAKPKSGTDDSEVL